MRTKALAILTLVFSLLVALPAHGFPETTSIAEGAAKGAVPAPDRSGDDRERVELAGWALATMWKLVPQKAPWSDTFASSAVTLTDVALDVAKHDPLFPRSKTKLDSARRTLALLLAIGYFESTFKPNAEGDCFTKTGERSVSVSGKCKDGSSARSVCMFQLGTSNLGDLGVTTQAIQNDLRLCAESAIKMIRISFGVCRGRPDDDGLAHYAAGGTSCGGPAGEGVMLSRHRMAKAKQIYSRGVTYTN